MASWILYICFLYDFSKLKLSSKIAKKDQMNLCSYLLVACRAEMKAANINDNAEFKVNGDKHAI
jgi:hypothetical protein